MTQGNVLYPRCKTCVSEQVFRFNNRQIGDGQRFDAVMGRVAGKRLTYRELCAIDDAGFMGVG